MFNLNRLAVEGQEVIFYPYRRAQVYPVIEIRCESPDEMENYRRLESRLCKMVTKVFSDSEGELVEPTGEITPDNHTCFMVGGTAIMFSDWKIRIGTELVERNW